MRYLLLLSFALVFACQSPEDAPVAEVQHPTADMASQAPDSLLRHVVMFSFQEGSYPDGVKEVEEAFAALPGKIPAIHSFEWGTNNSPEGLDQGLTHVFFVTFTSEEDRATYLPHPDHLAFVEVLKPHVDKVTVLDYWAK